MKKKFTATPCVAASDTYNKSDLAQQILKIANKVEPPMTYSWVCKIKEDDLQNPYAQIKLIDYMGMSLGTIDIDLVGWTSDIANITSHPRFRKYVQQLLEEFVDTVNGESGDYNVDDVELFIDEDGFVTYL